MTSGSTSLLGRRRGLSHARRQRPRGTRVSLALSASGGTHRDSLVLRDAMAGGDRACVGFTAAECDRILRQSERSDVSAGDRPGRNRDLYVYCADTDTDADSTPNTDHRTNPDERDAVWHERSAGRDLYLAAADASPPDAVAGLPNAHADDGLPVGREYHLDADRDHYGRERTL